MPQHRSFNAAKTEVRPAVGNFWLCKSNCLRIAVLCKRFDDRTSGISEAQHLRSFVKGLAGGIVAGPRKNLVCSFLRYMKYICMPAGNDESQGWAFDRRVFEDDRIDVPLDMIYPDKRNFQPASQRFRITNADEQRAYQSRPLRDSDCINVAQQNIGGR